MMAFCLAASIVVILISNILKIWRLTLFIEPYEKPNIKSLLQALSLGNLLNCVLPFRLGYAVRAYVAGKKMKNGVSFSLATILVEVFLDMICALVMFIILNVVMGNYRNELVFYVVLLVGIVVAIALLEIFKKPFKFVIYKIAAIFNQNLELKILKTSWFTLESFENILGRVNKLQLLTYSIIMWGLNVLSCWLLSLLGYSLYETIDLFFSGRGITAPLGFSAFAKGDTNFAIIALFYILSCCALLFCASFILKKSEAKNTKYIEILPHVNATDRLMFLEQYFNNGDRDYFKQYINLNSDVAIIEDYSAGSNATTMLVSKDGRLFYRKYSFGKDAAKLNDQIKWIHKHDGVLPLTKIIKEYFDEKNICSYDMPYVADAVTCFSYVHTVPIEQSWKTIKTALDEIDRKLHNLNRRKADIETIEKYIDGKVVKNLRLIKNGEYIKPLLKYKEIYINGKKYHNLEHFEKLLKRENLEKIFANDYYADIHGDLTIENIICVKNNPKNSYYLIDPNTGNVHESPFLDYGKLLQSIHGGYEFLMNTKNVSCEENRIEFLFTKSSTYYQLFDKLVDDLRNKFGEEDLKSIFYHEVIHWLRLMPYKIEKNGERSLLFYAGMIMVMSDVEERFKK